MYYVMQVAPREERAVETMLKQLLPKEICRQCFHLTRHIRKKYHGEWHDIAETLLPGYLFIETNYVEKVFDAAGKINRFTKLLGGDVFEFTPLSDDEEQWLMALMGSDINHSVAISKIDIQKNGAVQVVDGPLVHLKHLVRKFNLHKRIAEVEVQIANRPTVLYLGFDIVA